MATVTPTSIPGWEIVIGLECHIQLSTTTKAFSGSSATFGGAPNAQTDPTVLGLPGALPVLNRRAVELALRLGLASGCTIRRRSRFARKQYFYPDLPKGYQISQYDEPLCDDGLVIYWLGGERRTARLERIHMEEDAGKNVHVAGMPISLVDLNRAGVPLVEVVGKPDLRSPEEASEYLKALRQLVRYLGISDGNMEEGSLRCDANVSVRPMGEDKLGTRVELKNINSFKFVEKAILYEALRQVAAIKAGEKIVQETRLWDADAGLSRSMRSKEAAHDYRYFPDPDLPPLVITDAWLAEIQGGLPELPEAKRARFVASYGLSPADASNLTEEQALADYYEAVVAAGADPKKAANWVQGELAATLNRNEQSITASPISAAHLAGLITLIDDGTISGKMAKDVFARMLAHGEAAGVIVAREGLVQVTDTGLIEAAAREAIDKNARQAEKYRAGQESLLGFFVGQVMKATQGKANPQAVNDILKKLLGGGS